MSCPRPPTPKAKPLPYVEPLGCVRLKEHSFSKEVFEDLPEGDYEALKNDIAKHGIKVALHILPDKTVICGHQRLRAARELGLKTVPCEVKNLKNNAEVREWAIKDNLLRRQLTPEQRYLLYARLSEVYAIGRGGDRRSKNFKEDTVSPMKLEDVLERTAKEVGENPKTIQRARAYARAIEEMPDLKDKPVTFATKEYIRRIKRKEREKQHHAEIKNLILGDALDELKKMKAESIDCVVIDPPYGVEFKPTSSRWTPIKGDDKSIFPYIREVSRELYRVMKKDSDLYCFCDWKDSFCLIYGALKNAGFAIENRLIWVKDQRVSGPDFTKKYAYLYENVVYAKKGSRFLNYDFSPDVLKFDKVRDGDDALQKPVALLKHFIENSTVKGETVLDCFVGTGSTLVAAEELGRNWIGIEIDPQRHEIAKARILEVRHNA